MSDQQPRPAPKWLLYVVPSIAWAALTAWVVDARNDPPRGGFFTLAAAAAVTVSLVAVRISDNDKRDREQEKFYAFLTSRVQHLDDVLDTKRLPALRAVASYGVPAKADPETDAERMSGYAKGYADGLARKPIEGKVLRIDRSGN